MFIESLQNYQLPDKVMNMLGLIISQLNLLLSLVNDVLDIKLIQNGCFEPSLTVFNPLKTLNFVKAMFRPLAQMQRTSLTFRPVNHVTLKFGHVHNFEDSLMIKGDLPQSLYGDERRLKQVMINLVKNALKFAIGGKVRIFMGFDQDEE